MADNNQDGMAGQDGTQRMGNLIVGAEDARPDTGPKLADVIAGVRERMEAGEDPLVGIQNTDPEKQAPARDAAEDEDPEAEADPEAGAEDAEEEDGGEEIEADAEEEETDDLPPLPDGFIYDSLGKIKRADGTQPSADELEDIRTAQAEASGEETPESEADDGEDEEEEGDGQPTVVRLPAREEGDPDEEYEVDDPKLAESINRLRNDVMRKREFKRQEAALSDQRAELDYVLDGLRLDPTGFILDEVKDENVRQSIARHLMADPDIFTHVMEEFGALEDDEEALDAKRTKLALERRDARDEAEKTATRERTMRDQVAAIQDTIEGMGGDIEDEDRRLTFHRLAARDLADYIREKKIESIDPRDIPSILQQRGTLQLFGLKPGSAAARNGSRTDGAEPTDPPQPKKAAAPAKAAAGGKRKVNVRKVGERFKAAREKRESAAAVAPAGAGASPSRLNPPEGQGVRDRIKWFRKETGTRK